MSSPAAAGTYGPAVAEFFAGCLRLPGGRAPRASPSSWRTGSARTRHHLRNRRRRRPALEGGRLRHPARQRQEPAVRRICRPRPGERCPARPKVYCAAAARDQAGLVHGFAINEAKGGPLEDFLEYPRVTEALGPVRSPAQRRHPARRLRRRRPAARTGAGLRGHGRAAHLQDRQAGRPLHGHAHRPAQAAGDPDDNHHHRRRHQGQPARRAGGRHHRARRDGAPAATAARSSSATTRPAACSSGTAPRRTQTYATRSIWRACNPASLDLRREPAHRRGLHARSQSSAATT